MSTVGRVLLGLIGWCSVAAAQPPEVQQGESIDKAMDWAAQEIEGFLRT